MSDILSLFSIHCEKVQPLSKGQYVALCPFHDDNKRSFSFNEDGLYNCKACGVSGNAVKFAKHFNENPRPFYSKEIGGHSTSYKAVKQQDISKQPSMDDGRMTDWQEFNEKFIKQLPDEMKCPIYDVNMVGMDGKCLTFPYFNDEGVMDGIKRHKPHIKTWGSMNKRWYGMWFIKHQPKDKPLYIVEGEKDVCTLKGAGFGAVVSSSGGCQSIPTIPQIFKEFSHIIILYDNDKWGNIGAVKLADAIYKSLGVLPYIAQWKLELPKAFDCSDDYALSKELKETKYAIEHKVQHRATEQVKLTSVTKGTELMSINTFMDSDYEKPEIIVKHFLKSRSTTIIGGCTGVGKSWLSLNLAMSIAGGKPFMDYFETKKKKVIYAQFEMTNGEIQERYSILRKHYKEVESNIEENLMVSPVGGTYEEKWSSIEQTVKENGLIDAVLIVDNLYTSVSTDTDLSNNQDVMETVKRIDAIADKYSLHIIVVTHHLKGVKDTPILIDNILGGASLTRSASNVFQVKKSRISNDLLVGMITKNRGEECELLEVPFKVIKDGGYFTRGEIISNETLHYIEAKERWEIQLLKKLEPYCDTKKTEIFDREYLWIFLEEEGWTKNDSSQNKLTRFINRCIEWGLIEKKSHNKYSIIKGVLD